MAEDRTLLGFYLERAWARGSRVYVPVWEDQFVNSALIRIRLASGMFLKLFKLKEKDKEREREKEKRNAKKYKTFNININALYEKRVLSEIQRPLHFIETLYRLS